MGAYGNGYVRLYRKMVEWGWYSDSVVKDVFLHLLMIAAWKPGKYLGHQIKPGQAIIGFQKLAADLGFTTQQVRTAIKKLESTGEITRFPTNRFSIVTIENWEFYQGDTEDANKQITNNQQTNNKQITNNQQTNNTILKRKEGNKVKRKEEREGIPPTLEEVQEYCIRRGNMIDPEHFMDYYQTRGWRLNNGKKMKDWKACIRTWERRDKERIVKDHARQMTPNEKAFMEIEERRRRNGYGTVNLD